MIGFVWRLLLLVVPIGVGWALSTAGWPREQAFAAAILAGTALSFLSLGLAVFTSRPAGAAA